MLRGHTVTGLSQDGSSVTLDVEGPDGPYPITAAFVVGCDGAGSTVRKAAGIGFPGTPASVYGYIGDVVLDDPPARMGVQQITTNGLVLVAPSPGGLHRVAGYDPVSQDPSAPLTLEELRASVVRATGTDFGMRDPFWLTKFGNATRVAATYREGRVLVAGDAAHMNFPAGGVGLNVGVRDAMNLGWKLAAEVRGRASAGLLDTYHSERHPVGEALSDHTQAQTALITASTPEGLALRGLLNEAIATQPAFASSLADTLSALDVRYPAGDGHPLVGTRVVDRDGTLSEQLHAGTAILLTMTDTKLERATEHAATLGIPTHRSTLSEEDPAWSGVRAAIIRPDGHVWWATESADESAVTTALTALGTSFGDQEP